MVKNIKPMTNKCAVVLGKGKYKDERQGFKLENGPRSEFIEIASLTNADIISYTSAKAVRGGWFGTLFHKKPIYGSVVDFLFKAKEYDRCYVTGEDIGLPLALALKMRRWRGKIICVVHNITPRKARLFKAIGNRYFSFLIVVSKKQKDALVDKCGIPPHKIISVFNWVDTDFFKPLDKAPENDTPIVMACGAENRDYETLIKTANYVDASFQIFASGFFKNSEDISFELPPNIRQMPRVSFEDLKNSYQRADVVAVPLNNVDYAAGVTGLVEAMACGKPVVISRTSGIKDYLHAVDPAFQVEPGNVTDMARAINGSLAEVCKKHSSIGKTNRAWALENCALDLYAKKICTLLQDY